MSRAVTNALKSWRQGRGLGVTEAADMVPCTRQTWHSWEAGRSIPPKDMMARVVAITEGAVTPNDFYPIGERQAA